MNSKKSSSHSIMFIFFSLSIVIQSLLLLQFMMASSSTIFVSAVTQYHEQGLHGHDSYKYGFDTGDHHNPQQRYEERDGWGNVKGSFSYLDGAGHMKTVYYKAGKNGFYRSDDPANHKKQESKHHHQHHHHNHGHHHGHHHHGKHFQ